ncbi:hypothetical protein [Algivirga pacifica]|uniref:Right handed beta helix domain-containing protein n=1 Tax=Algivirga pacifica TaxID=1162670 RepID=A0ABP9D979_9BACT
MQLRKILVSALLSSSVIFLGVSCSDQLGHQEKITDNETVEGGDETNNGGDEETEEENNGPIVDIELADDEVLLDGEVVKVDHWIEPSDIYVRASEKADWNKPGTVLAFREGTGPRPRLTMIGFKGTEAEPIVIINKDKVEIASADAGQHAVKFLDTQYIRVLGNGNPEIYYGIHISESGSSGFSFDNYSSDFEVAYTHIENTGFAGILAKTDNAKGWTMKNVYLHHNHIHDVHGEGMYIGQTAVDNAHDIQTLRVHNNLIHDTGWDLFQVANVTGDIRVYNNTMVNGGVGDVPMQNQGFQIGDWSTGAYYGNIISKTKSRFLFIKGGHDIIFSNNYLSSSGNDVEGVFLKTEKRVDANATLEISNNFFRDYEGVLFKSMISEHRVTIRDNQFSPRGEAEMITYSGGTPAVHEFDNNNVTSLPEIELDDNYKIKSGSFYDGLGMGYEIEE